MSDIAAFLAARLDEDEAAAKAWLPFGNPDAAARAHIARHDPRRVLREVEATRALIADYQQAVKRRPDGLIMSVLRLQVMTRAAVYSDHADYDPGWAP